MDRLSLIPPMGRSHPPSVIWHRSAEAVSSEAVLDGPIGRTVLRRPDQSWSPAAPAGQQ